LQALQAPKKESQHNAQQKLLAQKIAELSHKLEAFEYFFYLCLLLTGPTFQRFLEISRDSKTQPADTLSPKPKTNRKAKKCVGLKAAYHQVTFLLGASFGYGSLASTFGDGGGRLLTFIHLF
jgi:hypothetical protein